MSIKMAPRYSYGHLKLAAKLSIHPQDLEDLLEIRVPSSYDDRPRPRYVRKSGKTWLVIFFHCGDACGIVPVDD